MRQSVKQLLIIVLLVFFILSIEIQTAYAYTGTLPGLPDVSTPVENEDSTLNNQSPDEVNENIEDPAQAIGTPIAQNSPVPLSTVIVNTPDADGIIIHTVKYGETLYTIAEAYGVSVDQILTNSGLSLTTTDIREGQVLVIQKATEPTATPSPTATIDPGTPTPTQIRPTRTPFPTRTPAPTRTPTQPPSLLHRAFGNAKNVGIGLIVLSGLGLLIVVYLGFLKKL